MQLLLDSATAILLGLAGSTHCIAMCGGISAALAFGMPSGMSTSRRASMLLLMSLGRVSSYALAGALAAASLAQLPAPLSTVPLLRVVAGLLLVLLGLRLGGWLDLLAGLEARGQMLWARLQPPTARLLPVDHAIKALLLGALWGWLPCGLVYSTLAWSATSTDAPRAALLMATFGLGTVPAVAATGAFATELRLLLARRQIRVVSAVAVLCFGLWTITAAIGNATGAAHHQH